MLGRLPAMSLRMLAPAALVLFAVVLLILVLSSVGGDENGSSSRKGRTTREAQSRTNGRDSAPSTRAVPRFYVVKPGDTLGGIAVKTGVDVEELMSLNPMIDPRTLVTGQRLKLRQ